MTDPATPAVQPFVEVGDEMLSALAHLAQTMTGTEIGLTVTVPGSVVTGLLVGRNAWMELLIEQGNQAGGTAQGFLTAFAENFKLPVADEDEAEELISYGYLHFKDAAIQLGTGLSQTGMLWRVRIDQVGAWSFVRMQQS
jgi:hypothetical protein